MSCKYTSKKGAAPENVLDFEVRYRKIPIISPGLIFVQTAFLLGLFSGELIFGGAYYWKEFCISKWVGLDNKNSQQYSPLCVWDLEGLFSGGLIFFFLGGGAYYRNFTVSDEMFRGLTVWAWPSGGASDEIFGGLTGVWPVSRCLRKLSILVMLTCFNSVTRSASESRFQFPLLPHWTGFLRLDLSESPI